jgi:hypothetical protein
MKSSFYDDGILVEELSKSFKDDSDNEDAQDGLHQDKDKRDQTQS